MFDFFAQAFGTIAWIIVLILIGAVIYFIVSSVRRYNKYALQKYNCNYRRCIFNNSSVVNSNIETQTHRVPESEAVSSHRYDDNGCYGINPASGLPLRSSGTDIAGNSLGSSINNSMHSNYGANITDNSLGSGINSSTHNSSGNSF